MNIVLIGGAGAQGSVMISELASMPQVDRLVCADSNITMSQRLADRFEKVEAQKLDATDRKSVQEVAKDSDIIVNLLSPKFNLQVMQAAVEVGAHYQDLAGIVDIVTMASNIGDDWRKIVQTGIQPDDLHLKNFIDFSIEFKNADLIALIHTGSAPGLVNVVARNCADMLDKVETIQIRNYFRIQTERFILFWWAPEVAWNDMAAPALLFENGRYKIVDPFTGREDYLFEHLDGPRSVVHHLHEEVATLPRLIGKGVKYVDFKYGGPHVDIAETVFKLGLLRTDFIRVKNQLVVPRDVLLALTPNPPSNEEIKTIISKGVGIEEKGLAVDVIGERKEKRKRWVASVKTPMFAEAASRIEYANPVSYLTGLSAAIFTKLIIAEKIERPGVFAPELLDREARESFLEDLRLKDIFTEIKEL